MIIFGRLFQTDLLASTCTCLRSHVAPVLEFKPTFELNKLGFFSVHFYAVTEVGEGRTRFYTSVAKLFMLQFRTFFSKSLFSYWLTDEWSSRYRVGRFVSVFANLSHWRSNFLFEYQM